MFITACQKGDLGAIKTLLEKCDPADNNNEAIRVAASNGYTEIVKVLLQDNRVNPADENNHAIIWAALYGHTDTVKVLLQDTRVDATMGIVCARKNLAKWMIQTQMYGYYKHKNMYDLHQQNTVLWFKENCQKRKALLGGLKWTIGKIMGEDMYYELKKIIEKQKFK